MGLKSGRITDEAYTDAYRQLLNESWKAHRKLWMEFIEQEGSFALGCYCTRHSARSVRPDGTFFCHRFLLADVLVKLCKAKGLPCDYYGELEP